MKTNIKERSQMNKHCIMDTKLHFLLSFLLLLVIAPTLVRSQFHELNWFCLNTSGNYTANSSYQNNLKPLLVYLTDQASHEPFGNYSAGEGFDKVNVIYNCRGDLNGQECHDCVKQASQRVVTLCPTQKEAIFWHQECMIRYTNRTIFSIEDEAYYVWDYTNAIVSDPLKYNQVIADTIDGLIKGAAYNLTKNGYGIGEGNASGLVDGNKVYCLVQCTPDILGSRCERCLRAAFRSMAGCCGTSRQGLQFYYPSCQVHYDSVNFIHGSSIPTALAGSPPLAPPPPSAGGSTSGMKIAQGEMLMLELIILALSMLVIMV